MGIPDRRLRMDFRYRYPHPRIRRDTAVDSMLLNVVLVFAGSVIGSIGSSSVVLYLLKRRDKVQELIERNNRIADGMVLQSEAVMMMLDALHESGITNGNGSEMKQKIQEYLMRNTSEGYHVKRA